MYEHHSSSYDAAQSILYARGRSIAIIKIADPAVYLFIGGSDCYASGRRQTSLISIELVESAINGWNK